MTHAALPQPKLRQIAKYSWIVEEPFIYFTGGMQIEVPRGFITDGASSPFRLLIASMGGHYPTIAVVHDYLYERMNQGRPHPAAKTRKDADRIFREGMKRAKVKPLVRFGMWLAARMFGGPGLKGIGVK